MLKERPRSVVTGASGGLGRAFAVELAAKGASILLADINQVGLDETAKLVERAGGRAFTALCDVAQKEQVEALERRAHEVLDGVDLLINNAGVAVGGPVGEVPLSDWEWLMGINLWGVIYGCHFFLPRMKRAGSGHIINVASIAGVASAAAMAPYNVSKAGVISLSETLAGEFVGTELGVTVLCPYFFKTNIAQAARSTLSGGAQMVEKLMARSKVQAPQVAQLALAAAARGDLYAFPHPESKAIAFMKRSAPELMLKKLGPWLASRSRT